MSCRSSTSQAAVASRAAAITQSFQLKPPSTKQPPTPARRPPSAGPSTPKAASAADSSTSQTNDLQLPPRGADTHQAESLPQPAKQALPRHASRESSQQQRVSQQKQQQQQQQQQQPGQLVGQQQLADYARSQAGSLQQGPAQHTLNLHQSDVYSPLQASAPNQVAGLIKCRLLHCACEAVICGAEQSQSSLSCIRSWPRAEFCTISQGSSMADSQAERRASSSHASSSGGQGASGVPSYPGVLPPRASGAALPEQHQSRSKRLASKLLKKMGTKERFRNPHADLAASGEWAMSEVEAM